MKKAIQIFVVIISFSLIISCGYMIIKSQGNSKNLSLSVEEQLASLYENEEDYKGLEIYHIEFWNSNDKKSEYDEAINKYSYPIKTTINELNKDFPFDQRNRSNVATPQCSIDINNDEGMFKNNYYTLFKISKYINDIDAYIIGGISIPLITNEEIYREHSDIDILCNEKDLDFVKDRLNISKAYSLLY